MVKGKKGFEAAEKGIWYIIAFALLVAIAFIIIYMLKSGPQNIKAVLNSITNIFT